MNCENFELENNLVCPVQIEKQVIEVEQFYESAGNVPGNNNNNNNSKGGSVVKEKGREKHLVVATKKPLQVQDAMRTETAAARRMQELMRQFSTILRQASASTLKLLF